MLNCQAEAGGCGKFRDDAGSVAPLLQFSADGNAAEWTCSIAWPRRTQKPARTLGAFRGSRFLLCRDSRRRSSRHTSVLPRSNHSCSARPGGERRSIFRAKNKMPFDLIVSIMRHRKACAQTCDPQPNVSADRQLCCRRQGSSYPRSPTYGVTA